MTTIRALAQADLPEARRIVRVAFGTFLGAPDPEQFWCDLDYVYGRFGAEHTAAFAGFARRAPMADGKTREPGVLVPQQGRVAECARRHGADFAGEVEARIKLFGQFAAGVFHFLPLTCW